MIFEGKERAKEQEYAVGWGFKRGGGKEREKKEKESG